MNKIGMEIETLQGPLKVGENPVYITLIFIMNVTLIIKPHRRGPKPLCFLILRNIIIYSG